MPEPIAQKSCTGFPAGIGEPESPSGIAIGGYANLGHFFNFSAGQTIYFGWTASVHWFSWLAFEVMGVLETALQLVSQSVRCGHLTPAPFDR